MDNPRQDFMETVKNSVKALFGYRTDHEESFPTSLTDELLEEDTPISLDESTKDLFEQSNRFIDRALAQEILDDVAAVDWQQKILRDPERRQELFQDVFDRAIEKSKFAQMGSLISGLLEYEHLYFERALHYISHESEEWSSASRLRRESSHKGRHLEQREMLLMLKENMIKFLRQLNVYWDSASAPDDYFEDARKAWEQKLVQIYQIGLVGDQLLVGPGLEKLRREFQSFIDNLAYNKFDCTKKSALFEKDYSSILGTMDMLCDKIQRSSFDANRLFLRQGISSMDCASMSGLMVLLDKQPDRFLRSDRRDEGRLIPAGVTEFREALKKAYAQELFLNFEACEKYFSGGIVLFALPFVFETLNHPIKYTFHMYWFPLLKDDAIASLIRDALSHRDKKERTIPILIASGEHCVVIDQLRPEEDGQEILCIRDPGKKEPSEETLQSFVAAAREKGFHDIQVLVPVPSQFQESIPASKQREHAIDSLESFFDSRRLLLRHNYDFLIPGYATGFRDQLKRERDKISQINPALDWLFKRIEDWLLKRIEDDFSKFIDDVMKIGSDKERRFDRCNEARNNLHSKTQSLRLLLG